jgi:aminoacrylate hydrolase
MPSVRLSDGELFYEVHGSGPPLITAAGLGGVGSFWAPQLGSWSAHFRVVVHDHRGTGQSSRDLITYSVPQMARDVIGLADALGIERFHFAGHSTGASIAQELALTYPDRVLSLVLASGWARPDPWFTRCFETRERLLRSAGAEAYVRAQALFIFPPWWVSDNDDRLQSMEEAQLKHFPPTEIVSSRIAAITSYGPGDELNRIRTPSLVTCADDDHLTPPHFSLDMHRLIPGSDLAILPTGGHFNNVTMPDQFNATILGWLLAKLHGHQWSAPDYVKTATAHHA